MKRLFAVVAVLLLGSGASGQGDFLGGGFGSGEPPERVTVEVVSQKTSVSVGDQFALAVVLDHQPGWHSWPSADQDVLAPEFASFAIRTQIEVKAPEGVTVGAVQWPEPHAALVPNPSAGPPVEAMVYEGRAVAFVPLVIGEGVTSVDLSVNVSFQACDESQCDMPQQKPFSLSLPVVALGEASALSDDVMFNGFDQGVFQDITNWDTDEGSSSSLFGITLPKADGLAGLALLSLFGIIGGLLLNLTPCVLPVIPIKVMTISQHAGSPGKSLILGIWMALGVVAFWLGIGIPAALVVEFADPSRLFGIWWITLPIGLIIAAMGVGIMGLFQIKLPQKAYMINPKADSAHGSFMFGLMTGVLGLPCFGFVAGALLAGSATMPPAFIITIFTSIGVGMALPYLVLAAKPSWVEKIPRTGPASELVKQVMGLLMLAAGAYFIGSGALAFIGGSPSMLAGLPWWGKVVHWWAIALLAGAAGLWLIVRTFQITKKPGSRLVFTFTGIVLGGAAVAYAFDTSVKAKNDIWVAYTEDTLQAALDDDKVVVMDFTAEWCLICKSLKAGVLNRQPVKGQLASADVVPMIADNTSTSAPGWDKLRDLGQTGIPLLVVWGPGLEEPWKANGYTTEQVMAAIAKARGEEVDEELLEVEPIEASAGAGDAVEVRVSSTDTVAPGETFELLVTMSHQEGWHSWPNNTTEVLSSDLAAMAIPTEITVEGPVGLEVVSIQWPELYESAVPSPTGMGTVQAPLYSGDAEARVTLRASGPLTGDTVNLTVTVSYQACNDSMCQMPQATPVEVSLPVAAR